MEKPRNTRTIILTAAGLITAAVIILIYHRLDPVQTDWMPRCPLYALTGLKCPGCGSQRLLHALLNGHIADAWRHNAALLILMPLVPPLLWLELRRTRHPRLYAAIYHPATILTILILLVLWTLLRNILQL